MSKIYKKDNLLINLGEEWGWNSKQPLCMSDKSQYSFKYKVYRARDKESLRKEIKEI